MCQPEHWGYGSKAIYRKYSRISTSLNVTNISYETASFWLALLEIVKRVGSTASQQQADEDYAE
ncbi:hypothetical protein GCM10027454_30270 [Algoriphagus aestuariicola]